MQDAKVAMRHSTTLVKRVKQRLRKFATVPVKNQSKFSHPAPPCNFSYCSSLKVGATAPAWEVELVGREKCEEMLEEVEEREKHEVESAMQIEAKERHDRATGPRRVMRVSRTDPQRDPELRAELVCD